MYGYRRVRYRHMTGGPVLRSRLYFEMEARRFEGWLISHNYRVVR